MKTMPQLPADVETESPDGHPVGAGVGAVLGGAAAGALTGSVAGPVGTVIGIAVGAIAGGLAGKDFAEMFDPAVEEEYWRDNYAEQSYVPAERNFDDFAPAYRYGIHARMNRPQGSFDQLEADLSAGWNSVRGSSRLSWAEASPAARDGWVRAGRAPGSDPRDPVR